MDDVYEGCPAMMKVDLRFQNSIPSKLKKYCSKSGIGSPSLRERSASESIPYVDSVGNVHGPMDQHHTSRLGAVEQSATYLPGTSIQRETTKMNAMQIDQSSKQAHQQQHTPKHYRHESLSALEHSDRELDRLLNELQNASSGIHRLQQQPAQNVTHSADSQMFQRHQTTTESSASHFSESGQQQPYRSPSANTLGARYTTRITRDHSQTVTPVTLKVVETAAENRVSHQDTISSRERLLLDELLQARQELDQLKRSRSLMGSEFYGNRETFEQSTSGWEGVRKNTIPASATVTDYQQSSNLIGNENATAPRQRFYSTDMNKNEDDYRAASSLLPKRPQRTMSSSQMFESHSTSRRFHQRPQHLNTGFTYEERSGDVAPVSTYSAHQEHLRQQKYTQQQQSLTQQHSSTEQRYTEYPSEVFEEVETITLQPIGKGVQDLDPPTSSTTMPRTPRATTPMSGRNTVPSSHGFSTLPIHAHRSRSAMQQSHPHQQTTSQHQHLTMQQLKTPQQSHNSAFQKSASSTMGRAPVVGGNAFFDEGCTTISHNVQQTTIGRRPLAADRAVMDLRVQQPTTNATATSSSTSTSHQKHLSSVTNVTPVSAQVPQSRSASVSSFVDSSTSSSVTLKQVQDSAKYWYQPNVSREETINLLKTQPPGSFIVRDSTSFRDAFGLAVKVASLPPRVTLKSNDLQSELVRHYLIEPVANKGVRLKGFAQEPTFPTLAAFIYHHVLHAVALPIKLNLPTLVVEEQRPVVENGGGGEVNATRNGVGAPFSAPNEWAYLGLEGITQGLEEHKTTMSSATYQNTAPNTETVYHHQQQRQETQVILESGGVTHQNSYSMSEQRGSTFSPTMLQQPGRDATDTQPNGGLTQTTTVALVEQESSNGNDLHASSSRIGVTTGASVYETLYLGNYDVICGDGQKAIKTAVDHVLKQIHASGRHTECQLEVSPTQGLTLSDNRRKLFVRRNFPKAMIESCGLDPKNRSYELQGEGPKTSFSGKIFAFVVHKPNSSNGTSEGICYVLCDTTPAHSATTIVKDILKSLKTQEVNTSS